MLARIAFSCLLAACIFTLSCPRRSTGGNQKGSGPVSFGRLVRSVASGGLQRDEGRI
ncbi:MAG: hypothetical protein MZV70_39960 [Desulfobacterales bacterium]|nr:hypothetical protein [Desulfobacterales bacterium]